MNHQIRAELLAIKGDQELLVAEEVVEWARSHPKSALYKAPEFYGWNAKKAAYEQWLWGARKLIALHITFTDGERKFVSLSIDRTRDGGGYRDVDEVLRDKVLTDIMLEDALRELNRVRQRYDKLKALKPVWSAVDAVKRRKRKGMERRISA